MKATKKSAHAKMRANNVRAVLNYVRRSGGASRRELQNATGLSHGAVSEIIATLTELGWLRQSATQSGAGRGRRAELITIDPSRATVVALHVHGNGVHGACFDFLLESVSTDAELLPDGSDRTKLVEVIRSVTQRLLRTSTSPVAAIGIATPGTVDALTGVARRASRIKEWSNVHLQKEIQSITDKPVYIDNDVRLLAKGHHAARILDGHEVGISVWLGDGIGAGITINGEVFEGAHGLAGELGHIQVVERELLCTCGNKGCLEAVASTSAVLRQAEEALRHGVSSQLPAKPSIEALATALADGDKLAMTICHQTARYVAKALAHTVNLLNPSKVVLAGPLLHLGDPLVDGIRQHLTLYAHSEIMHGLVIENLGPSVDDILRGAAALAFEPMWEDDQFILETT